jgi:hypothetical protein
MLPDIRAVFAAFVAAIGLMMIAFGAVAAFRVAQESHSGSLQADLAKRGQAAPPRSGQRLTVIETPGPHIAPPPPLPVIEVKTAPVGAEVSSIPVVRETAPDVLPIAIAAPREAAIVPAAETPIGGPLAEPAATQSEADRAAKAKWVKKLAAAKKARAARIARQRKAALARAKQQAATSSLNSALGSPGFGSPGFGNSGFGSTSGKQ